jgi:TolA-binding protein
MRTMTLRGIFTLAFLLAVSTATSFAQSLVTGIVVDADNKPVQGATVLFDFQDRNSKREAKTDKKGEFLFVGLPSGKYIITASKDGLTDQVGAQISGAEKTRLTFTLKPATATTTSKSVGTGLEAASAGNLATGEKPKDKNEYAELQATATAALEAVKASKYDEAIPKLNEVIGKMPNCSDCYMYLGLSLFETKQTAEAEAAFKKAVEIQPSVEGYTMLVRFYNAQKNYDMAAEMSKKASDLANAPTPAPGAPAAGAAPAAGGAAPAPATAAGSAPTSETAYNQGVVLWNAKKYAEAKPMFEAAVKANPGNADAQYMLGMSSLNVGQIAEARTAFQNYLKAAPDGPKAAEVKGFLAQLK